MSVDFAALAGAVVGGLPEIRACIFVSRDGLVLGAFPASEEARAMGAWSRLTGLGDVERGFTNVGEEMWVFARRNRYSTLAVASPGSRAGVVLDRLDRALAAISELDPAGSKARREPARTDPVATRSPSVRVETKPPESPPRENWPTRTPAPPPAPTPALLPVPVPPAQSEAREPTVDVEDAEESDRSDRSETSDRSSLAREFSGLFPEPERRN